MSGEPSASALENFCTALLTGGLSSAIAKTTVAPFERVRLVLQTQSLIKGHDRPFSGPIDCLVRIPREQGFASLWRGNVPNLLRIVPTYGLRFTFLDYFQAAAAYGAPTGQPLSLPRQMASGGLSGFATILVTYPLDLARTRMSAELDGRASVTRTMRTVWQHEGFRGLYRGLLVSALEISPYLAISLGGYEYVKQRIPEDQSSPYTKLAAAWATGLVGSLTCFPIDTVKRRIMLDGAPNFEASAASGRLKSRAMATASGTESLMVAKGTVGTARGAWGYVVGMYREGGVRIFYRGGLVNALKSAPAVAITFVTNDFLKDLLKSEWGGS